MNKILILEDEEVLGRIYKKYLVAAGNEVQWVATVKEAEDLIPSFQPDLVLVDHGIKGEDKSGLELIQFVKANYPTIKLVMLSNYSHSQLKEEVLAAGADEFLIKLNTPPKVLVTRVQQLFS